MNTLHFNKPEIAAFCRENDISQIRVFGSFVRGEETPESDVDLLVQFSRPKSLLTVVGIQRRLSELLGRPVDLLTEPAISPYLRDRILRESREIYNA